MQAKKGNADTLTSSSDNHRFYFFPHKEIFHAISNVFDIQTKTKSTPNNSNVFASMGKKEKKIQNESISLAECLL